MKKLLAALLALLMLASMALAEEIPVDVDFTRMDGQSAVNALYDIKDAPEENQGRTAKLRGRAYRADGLGDGPALYSLYVDDPSSCCGGYQMKFVPASPDSAEELLTDGVEVVVTGRLDFGEDGNSSLRLVDAAIELLQP